MKKILFLIPSLGGGGAEKVLLNLLKELPQNKYEIHLFCLFADGVYNEDLPNNIKYSFFFGKTFRGNIHLMKLTPPTILWNLFIKDNYDVAVSFLEGPMTRILGGCGEETKKIAWVHTASDNPRNFLKAYRSRKELVDTYDKIDEIVFVASSAKDAFLKMFPEITNKNTHVIYNLLEKNEIRKKAQERVDDVTFNKRTLNLVSVGRLIEEKGYERLINIVYELVNKDYDIHLYIIGSGELESSLKKIVLEKKMKNQITFLGFKDNPYKYVRSCDLFVCSSYREGFSTAVSESLIVGTPVVSTMCSGMKELLGENNEYGLITNNNDLSLYEGIQRMISNRNLLEFYKNQSVIRSEKFDKKKSLEKIQMIIDSARG